MFKKLYKRWQDNRRWAKRRKMSRIEYLFDINHDMLEGRRYHGGLSPFELIEKQLNEGMVDHAVSMLMLKPKGCFELANLYRGQGDLENAQKYLRMTLERYDRFVEVLREQNLPEEKYRHFGETYIKIAALLLDVKLEGPVLTSQLEPGYQPGNEGFLADCCIGTHDFDMGEWQALEDAWTKNRFPKYQWAEYEVYVKALTGQYSSDAEMLKAHAKMWAGKAKRSPDAGLIEGYDEYNQYVVDHMFAAVLKRIGWEGTYRHSWPNTCSAGTPPVTTRSSDRHLGMIEAPPPAPDGDSGIIEDPQEARRYIDTHVADQRDWWENKHFDPLRPAKEKSKVAAGLKEIGWPKNPATIDLMRTYRMDQILNDSTHLFLSDAVGDRYCSLKSWTELFVTEYGMSNEFIAVAESEEKADWSDPQGGWYVFWKKNKRVYQVERDDWHDPKLATKGARLGKQMWPNYLSFVAWWVAQHQEPDERANISIAKVDP